MALLGWDLKKLSTVKYETSVHEVGEEYENITVITDAADILLLPAEGKETAVTCYEQKNVTHTVTVKDGTLIIELVDTRKWYEHIGINLDTPRITLSLPAGEYAALSIQAKTADTEIPDGFRFESIDVRKSTGDITCRADAKSITLKTTTGDICVDGISAETLDITATTGKVRVTDTDCTGDVALRVTTGKAQVSSLTCKGFSSTGSTGDVTLSGVVAKQALFVERTTGDVTLAGCDAATLSFVLDTGDVTGTLLTEKVFIPRTNTGKVDVPKTKAGGVCEITTHTGNIQIRIEN